jgi:hypothetical protein
MKDKTKHSCCNEAASCLSFQTRTFGGIEMCWRLDFNDGYEGHEIKFCPFCGIELLPRFAKVEEYVGQKFSAEDIGIGVIENGTRKP